jgi:DNA-binding beta-propeller fold protein YncE
MKSQQPLAFVLLAAGWAILGTSANGIDGLVSPTRLAAGPDGRLYVSDYASRRVVTLDLATLTPVAEFTIDGKPVGLAFDGTRLYVGNETTQAVEVYDTDGTCLFVFPDPIELPNGIDVDRLNGQVLVASTTEQLVKVYDTNGALLSTVPNVSEPLPLGNPVSVTFIRPSQVGDVNGNDHVDVVDLLLMLQAWGQCEAPCPADLDGDAVVTVLDLLSLLGNWGPNTSPGEVLVSDFGDPFDAFATEAAVRIFDEQGVLSEEVTGSFDRPQGVTRDNAGNLVLVDSFRAEVLVLDPATGSILTTLGGFGPLPGELMLPLDLVLDRTTNDIFVANNRAGRIEVFPGGGQPP